MYSDQLEALDRAVLRRMAEDLEQEGVDVRGVYASELVSLNLEFHSDKVMSNHGWDTEHALLVAQRDAGLAQVKTRLARVNRALDAKRAAAAEAKAVRKAARK
jgi:hypothetical protein